MTGLHQWLIEQREKSCAISYMAIFIALIALALGLVHMAECNA